MTTIELLARLGGVRSRGAGKWAAKCPAHIDKSPSLSVCAANGRTLLHCFAQCEKADIMAAMGLTMADLFTDTPTRLGQPSPKAEKLDRDALAFRYELAALDRRLRVQRVKEVIDRLTLTELSECEQARVTTAIARAQADLARAELFEGVADTLRVKAFRERQGSHELTR